MIPGDSRHFRVPKFGFASFLLTTLLLAAAAFPRPAQDRGAEVIDATAMGTSTQVAPDTTSEGQAENRRVVVQVLQNKAIAGT